MTSSTNVSIELTNEEALMMQPDVSKFLQNLDFSSNGAVSQGDNHNDGEDQLVIGRTETPVDDSELHFDVDKGDVIFDYGTQEITGTPDKIGEHISQILESVLPNGLQKEAQGRLQAVVNQSHNKNGQNVDPSKGGSFLELQDAMGNLQRIQKVKQLRQQIPEPRTNQEDVCETSGTFRDYGEPPSRPPNFSVLISEKRPVCLFCEYCMVFGEPPRNMIKWYNRVNHYDNLPREGERKSKHSRKRTR
ncbi:hypothetical protein ZYGR_0AV02080 [Zygosaccharomyces rouxii]|uniref:Protein IBD2 n=1 Tax=Zygosaccharomyces rouxii TaxID=4956 RepID=A0A1Q3AIL8_ZYGRO|nr:hypothetical protein ZYGR_0AV02080 [Zygosaccharomyces rouxii]